MPFKKGFTSIKKPAVTVQTKKISEGECCASNAHCGGGRVFVLALLILNVVLTVLVLSQQRSIESMRVGGDENYRMLRRVFRSEGFQAQQRQQIQQAMQMYQITVEDTDDVQNTKTK